MIKQGLLFLGLCLFAGEVVAKPLTEEQLKTTAKAFLAAKNARQQPDSNAQDVERFLSFLANEFVDEHLKFNVTIKDKGELRRGMLAKLKDEIVFSRLTIDDLMVGANVVFVKYTEHSKGKPAHLDRYIEYTATNLMSLEFNDQGKIYHIRRHHGL